MLVTLQSLPPYNVPQSGREFMLQDFPLSQTLQTPF
jgi:hypothetical protein